MRFGLNHPILPKKVEHIAIKTSFEKLFYSLCKDNPVINNTESKTFLRSSINKFISNANNHCKNRINKQLHLTLSNLRNNKSIKILRFDKGNGTVILNPDDYINKLNTIISDGSKFKIYQQSKNKKKHPILAIEDDISNQIKKILKPNLDKEQLSKILPTGSSVGKLYGLAKIHKTNCPLRPVVNMQGTAQFKLAQYLDSLIKNSFPQQFMLSSTSEFLEKIKDTRVTNKSQLISYDIVSLFTNIPLEETIQITCDYVFNNQNHPPCNKEEFAQLLRIATSGVFTFNNTLYQQVDGVMMGSPLGPTLANIFMAHHENQFMNANLDCLPSTYLRYIDDTFCIFSDNSKHDKFLDFLNTLHSSIKFTIEIPKDNEPLPFLDTSISLKDNKLITSVYRKPTFTGLLMNFKSNCPIKYKTGLIKCLLHRCYLISSNWSIFTNELTKLKCIFINNAFPGILFDRVVNSFIDNKMNRTNFHQNPTENPKYVISLQYFGPISDLFKKKMCSFFSNKYNIPISIIHKSFKTQRYFSLCDIIPDLYKSYIIYKYECSCDRNITYIGKTVRHLCTRIIEHKKVAKSAIFDHLLICNSNLNNFEGRFSIMYKQPSNIELLISEGLLIKDCKPSLNTQNTDSSNFISLFN